MSRPFIVIVTLALLATAALPVARPARAQQGHVHGRQSAGAGASGANDSARMTAATEHAMSGHHDGHAMAHLRMTPTRTATPADSARAADIVVALRAATAKYRDVRRAEADGYRLFAPALKEQRVYHYTKNSAAIAAAFRFDPESPTSLLYVKGPDSTMRLVGAMYTAPKRASLEQLDRRVPLSMAPWHRHVDNCVPRRGETARWSEKDSAGAMKFGPAGSIATEAACENAGGRWLESVFGCMVHVNARSDDPRLVFESPGA
jgi:hypothetical protein